MEARRYLVSGHWFDLGDVIAHIMTPQNQAIVQSGKRFMVCREVTQSAFSAMVNELNCSLLAQKNAAVGNRRL